MLTDLIAWVNFIALVALIIQTSNGFVVNPELQAAALTVVNLILRTITKEGLA